MSLRDLAESQLSCQQQAQAAENAARQTAHVLEASRQCTEWFMSVLKTIPDSIEVTSRFDQYHGRRSCQVVADGITFTWTSDVNEFLYGPYKSKVDPIPGVAVIEARELPKSGRVSWYKVVTEHSYTGHEYATDLPSLALHLQAVDRVLAKRKK